MSRRKSRYVTEEAQRLEKFVGKMVLHKASGHVGILKWSGSDYNEQVGLEMSNKHFLVVHHESEIEIKE